jgi:hypothetical protein
MIQAVDKSIVLVRKNMSTVIQPPRIAPAQRRMTIIPIARIKNGIFRSVMSEEDLKSWFIFGFKIAETIAMPNCNSVKISMKHKAIFAKW